jgi:hypothetical protein
VELAAHPLRLNHANGRRQSAIERAMKVFRRDGRGERKARNLAECVNPGIGAA